MKKFVVNCVICDMTRVQEETLAAYESITVNCANALVSSETKGLISRYHVQMNTANVMEIPAGTDIRQINGKCVISAGSEIENSAILMVNGKVEIEKNALKAAQSYYSIHVNGKVIAPRSIVDKLHNLDVNGKIVAYPDDAILLNGTAVIDRFFALRAKKALYYADNSIVFLNKDIDVQKIIEKGATFETPKAIIAESFCEALVPLIDERAEIQVVSDGTAFIKDDAVLEEALIRRHGAKLYIRGDLTVKDAEALAKVEKLYVTGKVRVAEGLKEAFFNLDAEYDEMEIIREFDCEVCDKAMARIDRKLLEKNPGGVLVCDCALLRIDKDIDEELIVERLTIRDVAMVNCAPEQEAAVTAVSEDVAKIGSGDDGLGEMVKNILNHDPDTKVINAAKYVM